MSSSRVSEDNSGSVSAGVGIDRTSTNMNLGDEEPQSTILCRVCGSWIDISSKRDKHVAICEYCNEATPIRSPPPGQKYIRCPCNCLLICKSTAQRISCPRESCHRIILLYSSTARDYPKPNDISPVPGMCRVHCAHCGETFLFNSLVNQLARCPHCEKKSSVGREFARARGYIFLFLSILALISGITITIVTHSSVTNGKTGWIAAYVLFYSSALYFMYKCVFFLTMKSSLIIDNQS